MTPPSSRSDYEPQFPRITDPRQRRAAALNLAFRTGHPAVKSNPLLEDVVRASTANLTDFERQVLAEHILNALEAEDR